MGALGNDRSEAADDFSSTEILVGCPRGPVAVGYAGEPDKVLYLKIPLLRGFLEWLSLYSGLSFYR